MEKQLMLESDTCNENFSFGDIMIAFLWMPYKDFVKSIIADAERDIILQNIETIGYESAINVGLELNRERFDLAVKMVKLIASDLDRAMKFIKIMELYEQDVQLYPPYPNEELKEYALRFMDKAGEVVKGA